MLTIRSSHRRYVVRRNNFRHRGLRDIRSERDIVRTDHCPFHQFVLILRSDNKDKVEMYLAFGASRFEACKPIARDALRLALTPNINQMRSVVLRQRPLRRSLILYPPSVIGIIAIPGMMTGAILGGSSVEQAARLQMVIMFMISSCTALSSIVVTIFALGVVVDSEHRIRADRIDTREHAIYRGRNWVFSKIVAGIKHVAFGFVGSVKKLFGKHDAEDNASERQRLLG